MGALDLELIRVSKCYRSRLSLTGAGREWWRSRFRQRREFWAVRDLTFDVERGEVLGIIGPNGAGKSTILKLLGRITAPTSGEIRLYRRLAALIEVGSGFHPELSGRENVYLSGAILGMTRREITAKLESIVEFAGVADYIDSPVKWYSSGMYVRLGFAVAAHLDPEILLIDEVLAVGDEVFQEKCYRRVAELRRTGSTIVFISHDLSAVERLCRRALLMQRGQIAADDAAELVAAKYRRWAAGQAEPSSARESPGPKPIQIRSVDMRSTAGMPGAVCRTGYPLTTTVNYSAATATADVVIDVDYLSRGGNVIMCGQTTGLNGGLDVASGDGAVEFSFDEVGLQPGVYTVVATVADAQGNVIDRFSPPVRLTVEAGKNVRGYFYNAHSWRVHQPALVTRLER